MRTRNVDSFAMGAESPETLMIEVYRDGRWWMIRIPELDGLTQARWPGEVKSMARSYIAVSTGQPIDAIAVHVASQN